MNVTPVTLPFLRARPPVGALGLKNGRETGGRNELPSRGSALCTSAFQAKREPREGHFEIHSSGSHRYH